MNCKRCGKNVPLHSKVCPGCGLSNPNYVPRPEEKTSASAGYTSPYSSTTATRSAYTPPKTSQPKSTPKPTYSQPKSAPKPTYSQPKSAPKPTYSQPKSTPKPTYSQPKSTPDPAASQPKSTPDAAPSQAQSTSKPTSTGGDSSFVKFLLLVAVVIGIVFLFKNCDTMQLKGTWVASDGSSITFSDKNSGYVTASGPAIGGSRSVNFTYFVDGDEIEIKTADTLYAYSTVVRCKFEINGDTLLLTDLESGVVDRLTRK